METRQVRVIVRGRVQGVFFRAATREEALRLGVRGWVQNLPDGSVEVCAGGPKKELDRFLAWLKKGPPMSRVAGVEIHDESEARAENTFEVRY